MKIWHIYTVEYYSTVKKSEIMKFASEAMKLGTILLSEATQTTKDKHIRFLPFVDMNFGTSNVYISFGISIEAR